MTKPDANNLAHETSPYLLQHKDNPVHWQPWGAAALARAKRENKPILLSVGYAACHWCHVMAHESFEDADIAGVMNKLYVSIKVDREERPDIDHIYQNALALLGQQGGWPLTMFLTPDGEPFWGGTYFPPTPRYGRPGFTEVLQGVANAFHQSPEKVDTNKQALMQGLAELGRAGGRAGRTAPRTGEHNGARDPLGADVADEAARALLRAVDMAHGGFGGAPKFPQVSGLELLWGAGLRTGDRAFQFAVSLTAERMCQGGIYDHLGGGFARYAVDDRWLVPHFEKMLYDNAALIGLLTELWRETGDTLFRERVQETVGWLEREMLVEGGGFASSLDADSEHEEGKFYVWTEPEIDAVLRRDADVFKRAYDVTHEGNWEGHTILNRLKRPVGDEDEEARLAGLRAKLLAARAPRVRPGRDDKVLADWNGQMIAALAEAAFAFNDAAWRAAAERAFAFVVERMTLAGGRLAHSYREGRRTAMAVLDDYAHMARAALALHATTGEAAYLGQARAWVEIADRFYWDETEGGYFFTAVDAEALIVRTKATLDSPSPSGNAIMAEVLTRLHHLTGEAPYRERAEAALGAFADEARNNVYGHAALLNAAAAAERTVQIAIVGDRGKGDTQALLRAVAGVSLPARVLSVIAPDAALPAGHPAAGKGQEGGKATAYVCVGPVCSLPVTDRGALAEALRAANARG